MKPYQPGRRSWVKLWTFEFLEGSVRWELNPAERSIFIDFLCWAGKSRYPGIICAKKQDDGSFFGYPLSYIASILVCEPALIKEAIEKCIKYDKIKVDKQIVDGIEHYTITITNWNRYQSEYLRKRKSGKTDTGSDKQSDSESDAVEGEVEEEGEGEGEKTL